MLQLSTDHTPLESQASAGQLTDYTARLRAVWEGGAYEAPESSLCLSADESILTAVQALAAQKVGPQLKYSLVVGIGGSNLGTKAVYDALLGYGDVMKPDRFPKLLFAETVDAEWLARATELLDSLNTPEEIIVTVISKSGGTTETVANFEIIMAVLRKKFDEGVTDRVVAVTDEGSQLWRMAEGKGMAHLAIPKPVGGRYSVLSPVGLFPLLSVGVDIAELRRGAKEVLKQCLEGENAMAIRSAETLAAYLQNGYHINDNFFFHPELESLGKWYRQLMGESVGKEKSLDGATVHAGITPTVSLGSTDLHSVGQLYLGGPKDKLTTFVYSRQSAAVHMPAERLLPDLTPMVAGKSADEIMTAIRNGVMIAYQKADLPYMEVALDAVDAYSIGSFLQFKMLEMMYLGQLLNVNSFDQPNVESYKIETKRILEAQA